MSSIFTVLARRWRGSAPTGTACADGAAPIARSAGESSSAWCGTACSSLPASLRHALGRLIDLVQAKGGDYGRFSDYCIYGDRSAMQYVWTKANRLRNLLESGRPPQNESVEDSLLDLAAYSLLWLSYRWERDRDIPLLGPSAWP